MAKIKSAEIQRLITEGQQRFCGLDIDTSSGPITLSGAGRVEFIDCRMGCEQPTSQHLVQNFFFSGSGWDWNHAPGAHT